MTTPPGDFFAALPEREFVLDTSQPGTVGPHLAALDDLSEAFTRCDTATFQKHLNAERNDFLDWMEQVWGEVELARRPRACPTPLRMMAAVERFIGTGEISSIAAADAEEDRPTFQEILESQVEVGERDSMAFSPAELLGGMSFREVIDAMKRINDEAHETRCTNS